MKELIAEKDITVTGRGTIYIIDLKKNGFSNEVKVFKTQLKLGEIVLINNDKFEVKGIEAAGTLDGSIQNIIGLLLVKL